MLFRSTPADMTTLPITIHPHPFTAVPLLSLRYLLRDVVQHLAVPQHFDVRLALHRAQILIDAPEIGRTLGFELVHEISEAEREVALLPPFAVFNQRTNAAHQLGIGKGRLVRASRQPGVGSEPRRLDLGPELPLERGQIRAPRQVPLGQATAGTTLPRAGR